MNIIRFKQAIKCLIVLSMISFSLGCDAGAPRQSTEDYEREKSQAHSQRVRQEAGDQKQKGLESITPVRKEFHTLLGESKPDTMGGTMVFNGVNPTEQKNLEKSQTFLDKIGSIDISQCPKDYQDAFRELSGHWKSFHQKVVANKGKVIDRSKPTQMSGGFAPDSLGIGQYSSNIFTNDPALENILNQIKESSKKYDEVSNRYARFTL